MTTGNRCNSGNLRCTCGGLERRHQVFGSGHGAAPERDFHVSEADFSVDLAQRLSSSLIRDVPGVSNMVTS